MVRVSACDWQSIARANNAAMDALGIFIFERNCANAGKRATAFARRLRATLPPRKVNNSKPRRAPNGVVCFEFARHWAKRPPWIHGRKPPPIRVPAAAFLPAGWRSANGFN